MKLAFVLATVAATALSAPAFADAYPVSGKWGVSTSSEKGPIDCGKLRVINFNDGQRTDTGGGVPAYRNRTVRPDGRQPLSRGRRIHHRADRQRACQLHAAQGR